MSIVVSWLARFVAPSKEVNLYRGDSQLTRAALLFNIGKLETGDLIFSSTGGVVSRGIRFATTSRYSHASIYFRNGVILEANDDGVRPRRITPEALASTGHLAGRPYPNWTNLAVLRIPTQKPQDWERAIQAALRDDIGLDFPPLAVMARGASIPVTILATPFAVLLDFVEWVRNREPMAYGPWCSRLVGYVLTDQFQQRLSIAHRAALRRASPQRLFDVAIELGYVNVEGAVCEAAPMDSRLYDDARNEFAPAQEGSHKFWEDIADEGREKVRREKSYRQLRAIATRVGYLAIVATLAAIALVFTRPAPSKPAQELEAGFRQAAGGIGEKFALASEGGVSPSACNSADRLSERYDDFVNFLRDPRNYASAWNHAVGASDWNCRCLRWLASKHRVDFQEQLDYVRRPRCGPGSEERECNKSIKRCGLFEDPEPWSD